MHEDPNTNSGHLNFNKMPFNVILRLLLFRNPMPNVAPLKTQVFDCPVPADSRRGRVPESRFKALFILGPAHSYINRAIEMVLHMKWVLFQLVSACFSMKKSKLTHFC